MLSKNNKQLLVASLVDEMLNDFSPLNSFMRPKEYKKIYEHSKSWKSRNWFLNKFFFTPLELSLEENNVNFEIKLYAMEKTNRLSDVLAIIPYEFQYIKKEVGFDIILLRMYLGANNFRIATIEVSQDVYTSIQEYFQTYQSGRLDEFSQNIFDLACFSCVHEYSERIFRQKGEFYDNWEIFQANFERQHHISLKEYSDVGKYLWQADYLCFDNRLKKGEKTISILEQLENHLRKQEVEIIAKKKGLDTLKSMFIDEFGNYWKTENTYLNYKKS